MHYVFGQGAEKSIIYGLADEIGAEKSHLQRALLTICAENRTKGTQDKRAVFALTSARAATDSEVDSVSLASGGTTTQTFSYRADMDGMSPQCDGETGFEVVISGAGDNDDAMVEMSLAGVLEDGEAYKRFLPSGRHFIPLPQLVVNSGLQITFTRQGADAEVGLAGECVDAGSNEAADAGVRGLEARGISVGKARAARLAQAQAIASAVAKTHIRGLSVLKNARGRGVDALNAAREKVDDAANAAGAAIAGRNPLLNLGSFARGKLEGRKKTGRSALKAFMSARKR